MKLRANACIRIFFIFLAAYLAITIGCSGGGGHSLVEDISGGDTPPSPSGVIANKVLERSVDAETDLDLATSDGVLAIGLRSGSFANKSKISIFSYNAGVASTTLSTQRFAALSSLYNITFVDETAQGISSLRAALSATPALVNFLSSPAEFTFRLPTIEGGFDNCFVAFTNFGSNWQLLPISPVGTTFKFNVNNINGKFMIVKNYSEYEGCLEKAMEFSSERDIVTASASETIEKNIEVSLTLQTKSNFEPTFINSELDIYFVAKTGFEFNVLKTDQEDSAKINASALNIGTDGLYTTNRVSLFDYAEKEVMGNKYTFKFLLGIKGKVMKDLPTNLLLKARYVTREGISNSAEQLISFARSEEPINILSVVPAENSLILPHGQEFTITFNRDMDKTETAKGIHLSNEVSSETILLSSYKWNSDRIVVASSPNQLEFGRKYNLEISKSLTSDGASSVGTFTFAYVTASQSSSVALTVPTEETNVATETNCVLSFARNMKTDTFVDENFKLVKKDGSDTQLDVTVSEFTDSAVSLVPVAPLEYNKSYSVYVSNGVYDSDNSPFLATETRVFTTIKQPEITAIDPEAGTISGSAKFYVTFNRAMLPSSTANENSVSLIKNNITSESCAYSWENGNTVLVVTPNSPMTNSANYKLAIGSGLHDSLGNEFSNAIYNYTVSDATFVESVVTVPNSENTVATSTTFTVAFSKTVSSSISGSDFELKKVSSGNLISLKAAITSNTEKGTVVVTPQQAMDYGSQYLFTVKSSAKDSDNVAVQQHSVTVTTDVAPQVVALIDNNAANIEHNGVNVNTTFKVAFSKPMASSFTENAFGIYELEGFNIGAKVAGGFSWQDNSTTMVFVPNVPLNFGQNYILKINTSACDIYSNSMSEYTFDFITKYQTSVDGIVLLTPTRGDTNLIATNTVFTVPYNENLTPSSVNASTVVLTDTTSSSAVSCNLVCSGKTITVTPVAPLNYSHSIQLALSGNILDEFGQHAEAKTYAYTTDNQPVMVVTPEVWNDAAPQIWHTDKITLTFDKDMIKESAVAALTVTPNVARSAVWDTDGSSDYGRVVTITLGWAVGNNYTFALDGGKVKDKYGNPIANGFNKTVTVKTGVTWGELTLSKISNSSLLLSGAIEPANEATFTEKGVLYYLEKDTSAVSTTTLSLSSSIFANVTVSDLLADTKYIMRPFAIYDDHCGNSCIEIGTDYQQIFCTNPLAGGTTSGGYAYLVSTEDYPYEISTPRHLMMIGNHTRAPLDGYYKQMASIDMDHSLMQALIAEETTMETDLSLIYSSTKGFKPVGSALTPFTGVYNGNNKLISNLYINRGDEYNVALFSSIDSEAYLSKINLVDFTVTGNNFVGSLVALQGNNGGSEIKDCSSKLVNNTNSGGVYGNSSLGGIIAKSEKEITIQNCVYSGYIESRSITPDYVGGIVAYIAGESTVRNCYVKSYGGNGYSKIVCNATDANEGYTMYAGGLVGYAAFSSVASCSSDISVDVNTYWQCYGGAIAGATSGTTVSNCLATGAIDCKKSGALIGLMTDSSNLRGSKSKVDTAEKGIDGAISCLVFENSYSTVQPHGEEGTNTCLYDIHHFCGFNNY